MEDDTCDLKILDLKSDSADFSAAQMGEMQQMWSLVATCRVSYPVGLLSHKNSALKMAKTDPVLPDNRTTKCRPRTTCIFRRSVSCF